MFGRRRLARALNTKDVGEPSRMLYSAPACDSHRAEEEATRRRQYKSTGRCIACMACRRSYCLASKGLGNVHGHRRECYCMTRAEGRSGSSSVLRAPEATMQRNAGWARAGPLRRSETRRLKAASPFAVL
jgi:hypothetical protein